MKTIDTLVSDIGEVLKDENHFDPDPENLKLLGTNIGTHATSTLSERSKERERNKLWASDIGERCPRKTYYKFNDVGMAEPLPASTKFKFLYGNSIEELTLFLAKEAGHTVEHEQERVEYDVDGTDWRVTGRIDAVVDGVLVDVKSTSSYGFKKYKTEGLNEDNDTFGYIDQLSFYFHTFGVEHGCSETGFLWVDKQLGHIRYERIEPKPIEELDQRIREQIKAVNSASEGHAPKAYGPIPYGKSGNLQLPVACSYCPFKFQCWPEVRVFAYSHGPVYLTEVVNQPKVPEVT